MKQPVAFTKRLSALRTLAGRFAFGLLVVATFALMLLGKVDTVLMSGVQAVVADVMAPVMEGLSRPAQSVAHIFSSVHELAAIREDNARLREENERLRHWQAVAMQLEAESEVLKAQLRFVPDPTTQSIAARVIADTGGAFAQSVLITAGSRDGVRKGSVVVTPDGLVGRIEAVGERASRVLLLTDINSRLPVTVGDQRQKAILVGNNSPQPHLLFLHDPQNLAAGDKIVTASDASAFPPGLAIGEIAPGQGVTASTDVLVDLYADSATLDIVQVIDYGLTGILDSAGPPVPSHPDPTQAHRPVPRIAPPSGGPAAASSPTSRNGVVHAPSLAPPPPEPVLPAPTIIGHH